MQVVTCRRQGVHLRTWYGSSASYELFSSTEVPGRMALERMLAGLSTRHYREGLAPPAVLPSRR
jgi:hypothetical protein